MNPRLTTLLVSLAATFVVILTITPWPVGTYQDDAIYAVLAKSLAEGTGLRQLNIPGEPAGTHFPPGYPFFLAALWKLFPAFPDNVVVFKYANALLVGVTAAVTCAMLRVRVQAGELASALGALLATTSVVVLLTAGVLMSEPLFAALLLPALWSAERAADDGTPRRAAIAGLLIGLVALVRSAGIVALPALLLVLLRRRRWTAAAAALACAVIVMLPWQLWAAAHAHEVPDVLVGKYGPYSRWVALDFDGAGWSLTRAIVALNARDLVTLAGSLVLPLAAAPARLIGAVLALVVLGTGAMAVRRTLPVTLLFLAAYAAMLLVWPFEPSRFVIGVWAPLTVVAVAGTVWLTRRAPSTGGRRALRLAALACSATALAGHVAWTARGVRERWWEVPQREAGRRGLALAEWARERTAPGDVLVTPDELIVYLYGGRQALPVSTFRPRERLAPPGDDALRAALAQLLDTYAPRWFLSSRAQDLRAADSLAQLDPPRLRRADALRNVVIYDVIPASGSPARRSGRSAGEASPGDAAVSSRPVRTDP